MASQHGFRPFRGRTAPNSRVISGRVMMACLIFTSVLWTSPGSIEGQAGDVTVDIDPGTQTAVSLLELGATHMQYSLDPWGDTEAVARAKTLLSAAVRYQNQHIFGFGAGNINPAPGIYDWESLDRRIDLIRSMNAVPVITLCCAPDWMKGGEAGSTDWAQIEKAPLPAHYSSFAELARKVALRYPDVRHYLVWNEFKGFWNDAANNWDYVGYTRMYNLVYDALKAVDSRIQVGGPYLVVEGTGSGRSGWAAAPPITDRNRRVIEYWLRNKRGADFIVVDRGLKDVHDRNRYSDSELLSLTYQFDRVTAQIRAMTDLPIWWAEDYVVSSDNWSFQAAAMASMLYHELKAGSAVSFRWQPQGDYDDRFRGNNQALISDTREPGGGQPFPNYFVYRAINEYFPRGTPLVNTRVSSPDVEVLASPTHMLLINKRNSVVRAMVNGTAFMLAPYDVVALPVPGAARPVGAGSAPDG